MAQTPAFHDFTHKCRHTIGSECATIQVPSYIILPFGVRQDPSAHRLWEGLLNASYYAAAQ